MIYFLRLPTGSIKIGYTGDLDSRMKQLRRHYGCDFKIVATMPGGINEEQALHQQFAHLRFGREEQFRPGPDLCEFIGRHLLVGTASRPARLRRPTRKAESSSSFSLREGEEFTTRTRTLGEAIGNGFFVEHVFLIRRLDLENAFFENRQALGLPCLKIVAGTYVDEIQLWSDARLFGLTKAFVDATKAIRRTQKPNEVKAQCAIDDEGFSTIWHVPKKFTASIMKEILRRAACPTHS